MPRNRRFRLQPRAAVKRLQEYRPPLEGREGKLRLDFNENTVGCAPGLIRALRRALNPELLSCYPEYGEGRAILAKYFGVSTEEILITNGVDDAIKLICDTFVEPGDVLLVPTPTFSIYQFFHDVAGGRTRALRYDGTLQLSARKFIEAIDKRTRWIALANPNNPTGTLIPKSQLKAILEAAPRALVLVDEAYYDFSGQTILRWIHKYPNLVVARTFSKAFGLASLRIGFLFANKELAGLMRRAHAVYAVNSVAMTCATEVIRHEEYVRRYAATVVKNRTFLCNWLESASISFAPTVANFVLIRVGRRAPEIAQRLRQQRILVRDWADDPQLRNYLRLTIGTRSQMRRLMEGLGRLHHLIERSGGLRSWSDLLDYSPARHLA
jgi:histidinol-phosphate aminotransferase